MSIISVRDNENSRWKRNAKTKKIKQSKKQTQKRTRGTEAIVKGWELNDIFVHLS